MIASDESSGGRIDGLPCQLDEWCRGTSFDAFDQDRTVIVRTLLRIEHDAVMQQLRIIGCRPWCQVILPCAMPILRIPVVALVRRIEEDVSVHERELDPWICHAHVDPIETCQVLWLLDFFRPDQDRLLSTGFGQEGAHAVDARRPRL